MDRFEKYQDWINNVRDPANANSEGERLLQSANGKATASYEIAPLPDGRWAIRMRCDYHCGCCMGRGSSWATYDSREACIDYFLKIARNHFGQELQGINCTEVQQQARRQMNDLLSDGLFGFIEPEPTE